MSPAIEIQGIKLNPRLDKKGKAYLHGPICSSRQNREEKCIEDQIAETGSRKLRKFESQGVQDKRHERKQILHPGGSEQITKSEGSLSRGRGTETSTGPTVSDNFRTANNDRRVQQITRG